jgi:alpha-1,2-rhamnosyltransferase
MRYFIECTCTYESDLNTGIQRVVRSIANHSLENSNGREVTAIGWVNQEFRYLKGSISDRSFGDNTRIRASQISSAILRNSFRFLKSAISRLVPIPAFVKYIEAPHTEPGLSRIMHKAVSLIYPRGGKVPDYWGDVVCPEPHDVLILLDSSWHLDYWPQIRERKGNGVSVISVVYDLIPITNPDFCEATVSSTFRQWMTNASRYSDAFVCISQTTADALNRYLVRLGRMGASIHTFRLGNDLDNLDRSEATVVPTEIRERLDQGHPVYVYVGTIEPRKNHMYALDAFDHLWSNGADVSFVIVGKIGWRCDDIVSRILKHPQYGRKLFMYNHASDVELESFYKIASGLIFTSYAEGFGLPLVEALRYGAPVFASDISVFREIDLDGVYFVDLKDSESLVNAIHHHQTSGAKRSDVPVPWIDWEESTREFWDAVGRCLKLHEGEGQLSRV